MRKNVKVTYPKKRRKLDATKITGVPEPIRKTLYETSLENFKTMNRVTYLHRIIYAGEHFFPKSDDLIVDVFRAIIEQVNEDYNLEKLTGLFLYYNRYFVHVVEGDEDSLNKHIRILLYGHEYIKYFGTMKLVVHVSHISKRFITTWSFLFGTPAKLLGELDVNSSIEDSGRHIFSCIKKIYNLIKVYVEDYSFQASDSDRSTNTSSKPDYSASEESELSRKTSSQARASLLSACPSGTSMALGTSLVMRYPYRAFLPEIELLDFILRSSFTILLADYYGCYGVVPQRDVYKDKVWPVPTDYIPYDVFQKAFDTITELPKPKSKPSPQKSEAVEENKSTTSSMMEAMPRHVSFFDRASEHFVKQTLQTEKTEEE